MTSKEFSALARAPGSGLQGRQRLSPQVYLNGRQSVLPMHNAELKKGLVEAIKKQLGLK